MRSHVVFGGVSINPQMMATRRGLDVLVACPGRLMDLYNQNAVKFDEVEILVLDEADRMLDMGFIRDIRRILALMPKKRQNLLFSATFADEIRELATGLLDNPAVIEVAPRNSTAERIEQLVHPCDKANKIALLSHLVTSNNWQQVLVFTRTKHMANRVAETLDKNGVSAAAIHGNKSQGARTRALAGFKDGSVKVLVATDIAAVVWTSTSCRKWSTSSCRTWRKITCTVSVVPAVPVLPVTPFPWSRQMKASLSRPSSV